MRFWGKIKIEDIMKADVTLDEKDFAGAVSAICDKLDQSKPIICAKHHSEIKSFSRTVFYPDDFVESVDFDTFEIELIGKNKKNENLITLSCFADNKHERS